MSVGIGMRVKVALVIRVDTTLRDDMAQKVNSRSFDLCFVLDINLWNRQRAKAAKVATWLILDSSVPIASSRYIRMFSRPAVTSPMTETNQVGAPLAPTGMRSHS